MDRDLPTPDNPANEPSGTNKPLNSGVIRISDYLPRPHRFRSVHGRRRALTPTGLTIDADTLRRVTVGHADIARALYLASEGGMTAIPAPTPPVRDNRAALVRWLMARMSEASTYRGLFLCLGAVGYVVNPAHAEAFVAAGVAMAGAIGVLFADRPGEGS